MNTHAYILTGRQAGRQADKIELKKRKEKI
jgi:hypothetical protein